MKVSYDNIQTFLYTPGKYFVIPDFQRPYSWDKSNITAFLDDLEYIMAKRKTHYFGSIVYISEGDSSTIIDGQQRVTTVLLMLTALYHIITDNPSAANIPAQKIKENYLYNSQSYRDEPNRIKLRTVTTDNEIFERIFERGNLKPNEKDSKLYQVYDYFYQYFKDKNALHQYVDILENFEVVTIVLFERDDNPQKVFESINSTGKPLTDGDKIRNFALMLNNGCARKFVLENYWKIIETKLTDINKDFISDFFKCYLTSILQKEVKIEQVYPEFKKLFYSIIGDSQDDIKKLEGFYEQVLLYLNHYMFLKFNSDDSNEYKIVADKGFRLNYLKIETPYPFMMRVLDNYKKGSIDDKELIKIFEIVESYLTRRIICNIPTTGMNQFFATIHKDIENYLSEYPEEKYSDILGYILINKSGGLRIPKESEIKSAIKNNPIYSQRNNYINFILSSIDDQSRESNLLKQIANGDIQLTIEHIMPQKLSKSWIQSLGEDYEQIYQQYVDTLPNLTLTGYNSRYSNSDFSLKKTIENGFSVSPLLINQFIKREEKWDRASLEKRELWWFDQIEKIWPLPKSHFQPSIQETEFNFQDDKDLTGSKIKAVSVLGEITECNTWVSALDIILEKFFMLDEHLYDFVISDEFLHRYIKADSSTFRSPKNINGTIYYYESNTNTNLKKEIVSRLAEHLELEKTDIKLILSNSS